MQEFIPFLTERGRRYRRGLALFLPVVILFVMLSQTVSVGATTYVITDGDEVTVHTTFSSDPATVLTEAGVELSEDDTYTTQATEGGAEITVKRSQLITVNNCGNTFQVTGYGETVLDLLTRLGIPTYGEYQTEQALTDETFDGMQIVVNRVIQTEELSTEDIPFETTYCYDPTLPEGTEEILVPGTAGQLQRKSLVTYVNAQETARTVLEETVLSQPADQITLVGTGGSPSTAAPAIGDGVIVTATGEVLTYSHSKQFKATAYTHTDAGCNEITATGTIVRIGTVAVDPTVIPYGTRMFIVANDGSYVYGIATAEDCGGAIKDNRLDLYFPTTAECFQFGVRNCTVYFLD